MADVFAADRRVPSHQIGDKHALHETAQQHQPEESVPRPGARPHYDDGLSGSYADRGDDRRRTEDGEQADHLLP